MKIFIKIFIVSLFFIPSTVFGGFGITPPYVKNYDLEGGSVHEQKIFIVQRDPAEDLLVSVDWDVPGADDWISVDKGSEFVLPAGEQKFPILVTVNVPEDAVSGDYNGHLRIVIKSSSEGDGRPGTVTVGMGAKADVELSVDGIDANLAEATTGLLARIYTGNELPLAASLVFVFGGAVFFARKKIIGKMIRQ